MVGRGGDCVGVGLCVGGGCGGGGGDCVWGGGGGCVCGGGGCVGGVVVWGWYL